MSRFDTIILGFPRDIRLSTERTEHVSSGRSCSVHSWCFYPVGQNRTDPLAYPSAPNVAFQFCGVLGYVLSWIAQDEPRGLSCDSWARPLHVSPLWPHEQEDQLWDDGMKEGFSGSVKSSRYKTYGVCNGFSIPILLLSLEDLAVATTCCNESW